MTWLVEALRSSGRMFWPVAYMALAWAIMILDQIPRRKLFGGVLAAALLLQVVDTSVLRQTLVDTYQPKPPLNLDMRWLRHVAALRFVPAYFCTQVDQPMVRQIALTVERNGGLVEDGPIGRFDPAVCERSAIEHELAYPNRQRRDLLIVKGLPSDIVEKVKRSSRCTAIGEDLLCQSIER
jgi:hypothetical protein